MSDFSTIYVERSEAPSPILIPHSIKRVLWEVVDVSRTLAPSEARHYQCIQNDKRGTLIGASEMTRR
jgi:hypothetical protein